MGERRLIIRSPSGDAREIVLGEQTHLGRGPDNDVVLDDASVSRRHALLRRLEPRETILIDLGGANGTMVNGQHLVAPTRLVSGDVITIGGFTLTFHEDRAFGSEPPAVDPSETVAHKAPREEILIGTGPAMAV